jgi:acyl-CoA reductase-like NAD-dependent aldehyde dehydrogenase
VAAAEATDVDRAVSSARSAFDNGRWTRLTHAERAFYLRGMARYIATKTEELADIWARESQWCDYFGEILGQPIEYVEGAPRVVQGWTTRVACGGSWRSALLVSTRGPAAFELIS